MRKFKVCVKWDGRKDGKEEMEDRKTPLSYLGDVFAIYGISILILNVFCLLFGREAKGYSALFALGEEGLTCITMLQFFMASLCTVFLRFLFFTDTVIRQMSVLVRTVCMIAAEIAVIALFILLCGWFPVDEWLPWVMFFVSFGICFVAAMICTMINERMKNRRMQEALERAKKRSSK